MKIRLVGAEFRVDEQMDRHKHTHTHTHTHTHMDGQT